MDREQVMNGIEIRQMTYADIPAICKADNDETEVFADYLRRQLDAQEKNECSALLALYGDQFAGYVFLYYQCKWGSMKNQGLPGICDLVVFEKYRRKGIATRLMDLAEEQARQVNGRVYLDVCLNADYGPAQRFYALRGYVPDGKGLYYMEHVWANNEACKNDDELTLCLVKELK